MKSTVKAKRVESDQVKITVGMSWPAEDEARTERIFAALGYMLAEALSPVQLEEFKAKLEGERRKLAGGAS